MKINWHEHPFLRIFTAFAVGVLISALLIKNVVFYFALFLISITLFLITNAKGKAFPHRWISGLFINLILVSLGGITYFFNVDKNDSKFAGNFLLSNSKVLLKVIEPTIEKEKTIKFTAKIIAVLQQDKWVNTCGKTLVYVKKNKQSNTIRYGDVLLVNSAIVEINDALDPYEYNYKNYLENNNIFFQTYIGENSIWNFYKRDDGNIIKKGSLIVRNYFLEVLNDNNITGNNFAVASALVIGYEDKLTNETYSLFSEAGVLHILSVSGLHVAIIFYVFSSTFQFIEKIKHGKIVKAIILLFCLWFYASVTGLSPSVMRSAAMFSIVIVAQALKQKASIFNSMSASAFILLLINPLTLFDIGFQLSYLAVLGIVTFNPLFDKLYEPQNWLSKQVWSIISVSISAQLITLPISLYYFNQFPSYFLLANLIIIPLSTVILYLGLALALFGKIMLIATPIAWVFNKAISLLLYSSELITTFPNASIQHIYFSVIDMLLVYICIVLLLVFFYSQKGKYLLFSLFFLFLFSVNSIVDKYVNLSQTKLQVHAIKKKSVYSFSANQNLVLFADSNFYADSYSKKWMDNLITKTNSNVVFKNDTLLFESLFLKFDNNFLQTKNKHIYVINKTAKTTNQGHSVDYVVVSNMSIKNMKKNLESSVCKNIVIDGSVPLYKAIEISAWLRQRNYNVHCVLQDKTIQL